MIYSSCKKNLKSTSRKKNVKLVSVEFLDRAITFNWIIIFERKNIERANNRFRENRARNIWQMSRFEKQKLQAPHSYFSQLKWYRRVILNFTTHRHTFCLTSATNVSSYEFSSGAHRPLAGKGILRSAFLNRARASDFTSADMKYFKRYQCIKQFPRFFSRIFLLYNSASARDEQTFTAHSVSERGLRDMKFVTLLREYIHKFLFIIYIPILKKKESSANFDDLHQHSRMELNGVIENFG